MKTGIGLCLDPVGGAVAIATAAEGQAELVSPSPITAPAAVVRVPGRTLLLHRSGPMPVDGAGISWPPQAKQSLPLEQSKEGRYPIAWVWDRLLRGKNAINAAEPADRAADALALYARALLPESSDECATTLIIPDRLDEGNQQSLLDACRIAKLPVSLLWRPIAAAMAWLERHGISLVQPVDRETSIGWILALHLGLDGVEATWVDLILRPQNPGRVLPARRRPDAPRSEADFAWTQWAATALSRAAELTFSRRGISGDGSSLWRYLWSSPGLLEAIGSACGRAESCDYGFPGGLGREVIHEFVSRLQVSELCSAANVSRGQKREGPVVGAVVTGELARVVVGPMTLGRRAVEKFLGPRSGSVLVEGEEGLECGALARAAATYAFRKERGLATYLDTLPRMEVLLEHRARPKWCSLLKEDQQYVEGGKTWSRDPDLGGLSIRRGQQEFNIPIWVEGEEKVRTARFELPDPPREQVSSALRPKIEPAGGRASVELIPDKAGALGPRRILLHWDRARVGVLNKEEELVNYPLKCPVVQPCVAALGAWADLEAELQALRRHGRRSLAALRNLLRAPPAAQLTRKGSVPLVGLVRALDSNGRLHDRDAEHQGEIDEFWRGLAQEQLRLIAAGKGTSPDALRCLGYACSSSEEVDDLVFAVLSNTSGKIPGEVACLVAGCSRQNGHYMQYLRLLTQQMANDWDGFNVPLKCAGHLLMWREYAVDTLGSDDAIKLVFQARQVLASTVAPELVEGPPPRGVKPGIRFIQRGALVLIAFLLRKRVTDASFLAPESAQAKALLRVLERAKFRVDPQCPKREQVEVIGGAVNVPRLIQQVIDYVNEKGIGAISVEDER